MAAVRTLAYGRTAEHPLPAPILGHSEYQADPAFDRERAALLARLPEQTPCGCAAVPKPAQSGSEPALSTPKTDQGSSGKSSG